MTITAIRRGCLYYHPTTRREARADAMRAAIAIAGVALLVACRRDEPKPAPAPPVRTASVAPAPEPPAPYLFTVDDDDYGASVGAPSGFTVARDRQRRRVVGIPDGGTVTFDAMGSCGLSLARMCKRVGGAMHGDQCEAPGEWIRANDRDFHALGFEGDVPAYVKASWKIPAESTTAFYCSVTENVMNALPEDFDGGE